MNRRDFIAGLASAVAWPMVARAQQGQRVRRVGVLMGYSQEDPRNRNDLDVFLAGLAQLGWRDPANVRIEQRWAEGKIERARTLAKELIELRPDVIFATTTPVTAALMRETHNIPIVFAIVSDPVGAGFVASLAHPGGNITGIINIEAQMGGKWLGLLKEMAPGIKRAAMMFNPTTAPGGGKYFLPSFEAAAQALAVEAITLPVRSESEIERAVANLGRQSGLVVMTDSFMIVHHATIISATIHSNMPAIMDYDTFVREGGLMSYGPRYDDLYHRAAGYVDLILRGTQPADLPVELPTLFDLVINLKTAKALGLTVPPLC